MSTKIAYQIVFLIELFPTCLLKTTFATPYTLYRKYLRKINLLPTNLLSVSSIILSPFPLQYRIF